MIDCAIIGTGAAGVSAALTLKALKRSFVLLGSLSLSKKICGAEHIKNYPGLENISGEGLKAAFLNQLNAEGIQITEDRVNGVYPTDGGYTVTCAKNSYEVKTVILATGVESFKPIAGELEYLGRGVSYCAVCDGFLYRDKDIAVIVEGEENLEEVALLSKYARTVSLFSLGKGVNCNMQNVKVMQGRPLEIVGDMRVRSVKYQGGELPADGVFVLKQSVAANTLVHGLKTEGGIVIAAKDGSTNLAGVFAAGDCTGRPYQYAKAIGEGNVCAHSVAMYLRL